MMQQIPLRWYNLYGAPEFKNDKFVANLKKGAQAIAKGANRLIGSDINWSEYYNNAPDKAPCFKGRVLVEVNHIQR